VKDSINQNDVYVRGLSANIPSGSNIGIAVNVVNP